MPEQFSQFLYNFISMLYSIGFPKNITITYDDDIQYWYRLSIFYKYRDLFYWYRFQEEMYITLVNQNAIVVHICMKSGLFLLFKSPYQDKTLVNRFLLYILYKQHKYICLSKYRFTSKLFYLLIKYFILINLSFIQYQYNVNFKIVIEFETNNKCE